MYGVQTGMNYTLNLSLQHHATNPNALTLEGKQLTIVSGPGEGQTATITGYDPETLTYTLDTGDTQWATPPTSDSKFEITESTAALPGYQPSSDSYKVVLTSAPTAPVYIDVTPQPTPTYDSSEAFDPSSNYGQNNVVQVRVKTPRALFLLTGMPAAGETWTITIDDQPYSYRVGATDTLATIASALEALITGANAGYSASIDPSNLDQVVVVADAGQPSFYAGFQITHALAGGADVTPLASSGLAITFTGSPAAGEVWTLTLAGTDYQTTATSTDTLATIVQTLAGMLPSATYTISVAGTVLNVIGAGLSPSSASVAVSAPTVGTITNTFQFFNEAEVQFTGEPVAGERFTIVLDGVPIGVTSTAGESLAQVVHDIGVQIPFGYQVGISLDSLFIIHGTGLFGGFLTISLSGSVSISGASQPFGGATAADHAPDRGHRRSQRTGRDSGRRRDVDAEPRRSHVLDEGRKRRPALRHRHATRQSDPDSRDAQGGPSYSTTVSGSTLTIRRIDQPLPIIASVSVSSPGTASTALSGNTASITYGGTPLDGELWAVSVDGTTYSYLSKSTDTVSGIVTALQGLIQAAAVCDTHGNCNYTATTTGGGDTLQVVSNVSSTIDAFGAVVLATGETQGDVTTTASGLTATIALDGPVGANADLDAHHRRHAVPGDLVGHRHALHDRRQALGALAPSGTYDVTVTGSTIALSRVDGTTVAASLAVSTLGAPGGSATAKTVAVDFEGQPAQGELWTLTVDGVAHSFGVLYGDTLADIATGLGRTLPLGVYDVSVLGRVLTISRVDGAPVSAGVTISPDSQGAARVTQQLVFDQTNWDIAQTVTVQAIDNQIVDGHDALVFAPLTGRTDAIRGPVTIDGGVSINPEPFLTHPLMLPGETNQPLADGTLSQAGVTNPDGTATITDPNATNVSATDGLRPGFDPRMNDFAYTVQFLNGQAAGTILDVASTSHDILSIANTTPFTFDLSSSDPAGIFRLIGTPDQSMPDGTLNTVDDVRLTGVPNAGEVWTLTLDGTHLSYTVGALDRLSDVAAKLAALATAAHYDVTVQVAADKSHVDLFIWNPASAVRPAVSFGITQVHTPGAWTLTTPAGPFPLTLSAPGFGSAILTSPADSAAMTAALQTIYGTTDVTAVLTGTPGLYLVTFGGTHTSLDFSQLTGGTVAASGPTVTGHAALTGATQDEKTLTYSAGTIDWTQADVTFTGLPNVGDVWTLTLDGHSIPYTVQQGDDVASRVALAIAALVPSTYHVEARVGILGDSELIITKGGDPFTVGFGIVAAGGRNVLGSVTVSGTPAVGSTGGLFTMAAAQILSTGPVGTTWSLTIGPSGGAPVTETYTVQAGDDLGAITAGLARLIPSNYQALVSGTSVTFKTGFEVDSQGNPLVPAAGDEYVVTPLNLNTRVDESTQVDTLNFDNSNSPQNDVGTITESTLTGFGMGGDTVIAGQPFPGGIAYSNIETLNVKLGSGDNHLTIASTSDATTNVTTGNAAGNGDNTIDVLTISGPTSITTGSGDDTVVVSTTQSLIQLGGLLTIDTGAGDDTVTVDDSAQTTPTPVTVTGSTVTGFGPPSVDEEQSFTVRAASGSYTLLLPGALQGSVQLTYLLTSVKSVSTGVWTLTTTGSAPITISAPGHGFATLPGSADSAAMTAALQAIYGTTDVSAVLTGTPGVYTVTFSGTHTNVDFSQLTGDDAASIQAKLRAAYGFDDIAVTETTTSTSETYTVDFNGRHSGIDFGQITWVGVWTLATTGPYPLTLTDPNYGFATLQAPADSAAMTNALQSIYHTTDITAVLTAPGLYTVTLAGDHAGLDLSNLTGASATPVAQLDPQPDASASVRTSTVHDGTTTPEQDVLTDEVQTFTVRAASGTYTLLLPGALPGHASDSFDYVSDNASTIQAKLRADYGFADITVTETTTASAETFTVDFAGAHSGIDFGQITWVGVWTLTLPTASGSYPLTLDVPPSDRSPSRAAPMQPRSPPPSSRSTRRPTCRPWPSAAHRASSP